MRKPKWTPEACEAVAQAYVARSIVNEKGWLGWRHPRDSPEREAAERQWAIAYALVDTDYFVVDLPRLVLDRISALYEERGEPSPTWPSEDPGQQST